MRKKNIILWGLISRVIQCVTISIGIRSKKSTDKKSYCKKNFHGGELMVVFVKFLFCGASEALEQLVAKQIE